MKALALLLLLTGCAAKQPCRNCVYRSRMVAHYDRKDCHDLLHGLFQCKSVIFDPQTLNLK